MNYLLDTHVILWWLTEPTLLSTKARKILSDKKNPIFCSSVSFWEMVIKKSIGKLTIPNNILDILKKEGFDMLPLLPEDTLSVSDLPRIHDDPFDRMLIIQAKLHDLILITRDAFIPKYELITLKA